MGSGGYRFKHGHFECLSLCDGSRDYPLGSLFANVSIGQVKKTLQRRNLPTNNITTPYTYLYVNTGEHRVLVDMGAGSLSPSTGRLLHSLNEAGISPAQIDTVIITHAHPDHIGGSLDEEGRLVYSGASFFISADEWEFWLSKDRLLRVPEGFADIARKNLEPLRHHVNLIDGESEIVPGIRAIPAPGHTPGHLVVEVFSADELLLYIGDTVLHPLHLEHPNWLPIYDILPEQAAASKRRIFDQAAARKALVLGQHFAPFPSLGTVTANGEGWLWRPINMTGKDGHDGYDWPSAGTTEGERASRETGSRESTTCRSVREARVSREERSSRRWSRWRTGAMRVGLARGLYRFRVGVP
jgi:glyoxylase-like metal-dependent hydrolase (beta-lactamase superfamily II)